MQDKISLLMEETGCDRGQAELALQMCGDKVEEAVELLARQMRHIVVLKGKFAHADLGQYGLFLMALNAKSGALLRSRAVLSYNPAVYAVSLEKDWFEFEKHLYGCRLWEGSLQAESLEIERILGGHFRALDPRQAEELALDPGADAASEIALLLGDLRRADSLGLRVRKDVLDLRQFQSLGHEARGPLRPRSTRPSARPDQPLTLGIALDEDSIGIVAGELRAGDMVSARIADQRDIALYLAKIFGGYSERGAVPILAPVEAVESVPPDGVLVRVRFSAGVCGDARVGRQARLKVVRIAVRNQEAHSWWRRFFWG